MCQIHEINRRSYTSTNFHFHPRNTKNSVFECKLDYANTNKCLTPHPANWLQFRDQITHADILLVQFYIFDNIPIVSSLQILSPVAGTLRDLLWGLCWVLLPSQSSREGSHSEVSVILIHDDISRQRNHFFLLTGYFVWWHESFSNMNNFMSDSDVKFLPWNFWLPLVLYDIVCKLFFSGTFDSKHDIDM